MKGKLDELEAQIKMILSTIAEGKRNPEDK
jgi:hypothetical protein